MRLGICSLDFGIIKITRTSRLNKYIFHNYRQQSPLASATASRYFRNFIQLFWPISLFKLVNVAIIIAFSSFGVTRCFIGLFLSLYFAPYALIKRVTVSRIRWPHVKGDVVAEIIWQGSPVCVARCRVLWTLANDFMHCLPDNKLWHFRVPGYGPHWLGRSLSFMISISPTNSGTLFLSERAEWVSRVAVPS